MKLDFAATHRNRGPLWEALSPRLPGAGLVLELASGSGQHITYFAGLAPDLRWQPSDPDPAHRASIEAWTAGMAQVAPPLDIDVHQQPWPVERASAVLCANLLHIAPESAGPALFRGAAQVLPIGHPLFVYGPFKVAGRHTAPSNVAFDESLRARDPAWGVRDMDELAALAELAGLGLDERLAMPANNFTLVFRRLAS